MRECVLLCVWVWGGMERDEGLVGLSVGVVLGGVGLVGGEGERGWWRWLVVVGAG